MRSKFRMTCMLIGAAAMTNVRRIQRYLAAKQEQENECKETKGRAEITWDHKMISFYGSLLLSFKRLVGELSPYKTCFGCLKYKLFQ